MNLEIILLLVCGAGGALTKDILQDNALIMPKKKDGKIYLGFIGAMIVGAIIGFLVDHSPITAFSTSFMGMTTIENLLIKKITNIDETSSTIEQVIQVETTTEEKTQPKTKEEIKSLIRKIAKAYEVDHELAIKVATCESGLNPKARLVNSPKSIDRGLFQINSYYHPHVTDAQADDPEFATRFFCEAVKNGNLSWWNCSKNCWDK